MTNQLKEFTAHIFTSFGLGCFKIKANSFEDAFNRLGKKDKSKAFDICDDNGQSICPTILEQLQNN